MATVLSLPKYGRAPEHRSLVSETVRMARRTSSQLQSDSGEGTTPLAMDYDAVGGFDAHRRLDPTCTPSRRDKLLNGPDSTSTMSKVCAYMYLRKPVSPHVSNAAGRKLNLGVVLMLSSWAAVPRSLRVAVNQRNCMYGHVI